MDGYSTLSSSEAPLRSYHPVRAGLKTAEMHSIVGPLQALTPLPGPPAGWETIPPKLHDHTHLLWLLHAEKGSHPD